MHTAPRKSGSTCRIASTAPSAGSTPATECQGDVTTKSSLPDMKRMGIDIASYGMSRIRRQFASRLR